MAPLIHSLGGIPVKIILVSIIEEEFWAKIAASHFCIVFKALAIAIRTIAIAAKKAIEYCNMQ